MWCVVLHLSGLVKMKRSQVEEVACRQGQLHIPPHADVQSGKSSEGQQPKQACSTQGVQE